MDHDYDSQTEPLLRTEEEEEEEEEKKKKEEEEEGKKEGTELSEELLSSLHTFPPPLALLSHVPSPPLPPSSLFIPSSAFAPLPCPQTLHHPILVPSTMPSLPQGHADDNNNLVATLPSGSPPEDQLEIPVRASPVAFHHPQFQLLRHVPTNAIHDASRPNFQGPKPILTSQRIHDEHNKYLQSIGQPPVSFPTTPTPMLPRRRRRRRRPAHAYRIFSAHRGGMAVGAGLPTQPAAWRVMLPIPIKPSHSDTLRVSFVASAFAILFTSYNVAQTFLTTLFPKYGFYSFAIIYICFALGSLVAPNIGRHLGLVPSMVLGGSTYVGVIATFLTGNGAYLLLVRFQ